ncbi:XRE family transcriptional regulator [Geoglobus ahangari]|nr:XRE family transcriptional regulator [Geoglobus ahangari]
MKDEKLNVVEEIPVDLNPDVMKWLRKISGYSIEEVADKLKIETEELELMEEGKIKPSFTLIKELSKLYKVPVAAFFLPKPREIFVPKDYRFIHGREGEFNRETLLVFRKVRGLQKVAKELLENLEYSAEPRIMNATLRDDPDKVAEKYREEFELSEYKQIEELKDAPSLFRYLRHRIEELNVFVFQYGMPVEDARGFTLIDDYPAIITINSRDQYKPRIFTLMHEFGHILLGESAVDMPNIAVPTKNRVEKWCNEFAASFLLPKDIAIRVFENHRSSLTRVKTLNKLSARYKVSKHMLLYTMLKLDYISKKEYDTALEKIKIKSSTPKKKSGGPKPEVRILSELGEKYLALVIQNYRNNLIPYSAALEAIPSAKTRTFNKLVEQVGGVWR